MSDVVMGNYSITYAIYNPKWTYGIDERLLKIGASEVTPEEYEQYMHGSIFCPKCFTPLSRNPSKKNVSKNAKTAHFRHLPSFKHIPCAYHTTQQDGFNYVNDELTSETEEDGQFKRVKEWAKLPPEEYMKGDKKITYNGINHDPEGEITEEAIPRHNGNKVKVGSNIETVQYICWNLDSLLNVGFSLPGKQVTLPLKDLLYNTQMLRRDISEEPQLFYGKMKGFHYQTFSNRTKIQCHGSKFMYIYTKNELDERRSFGADSIGRYVMFFGSVKWDESKKTYVMLDEWGSYAVVPRKLEPYLEKVTSHV
ncbi:hypothetical protein [Vibrio harveyi]|uniref:hypothetical protein n=1 Tax=Vibrio harveyi TaxID=669 RepID=UPI003BB80551